MDDELLQYLVDQRPAIERRDGQAVFGVLHRLDFQDLVEEVSERAGRPALQPGSGRDELGR
jgi:hypothetical protein